ncbi:MAG: sigma-70 family RNA polymerase sigma factor [Clostridiales bacterium]|nr:sigma-70 family RNA polymerase sigma factor [Clostridiales bacterium]
MDRRSDEELVVLCLCGQKEAFSLLVQRYQKQVFSLAFNLGGDYEDANDWTQDVFLQVYRSLPAFDADKGKFFSWMYGTAHNVCVNRIISRDGVRPRKRLASGMNGHANDGGGALRPKRRETVPLDSIAELEAPKSDVESHPEEYLERAHIQEEVRRAMAALPEKYRMPIMLQLIEGFTYREISEHLQLPQSTVETRLFRARQMLQVKLDHLVRKE